MKEPQTAPACERCRRRRNKCDRTQPSCLRCDKAGIKCEYKSRNASAVFMRYVEELEAEIARLENEVGSPRSPQSDRATTTARIESLDSGSDAGMTVDDLFDHPESREEHAMSALVEGFSKVSLSATTEIDGTSRYSENVLLSIILSAAIPGDLLHGKANLPPTIMLPPHPIALRTIQRFSKEVLPTLPFISPLQLEGHLGTAYNISREATSPSHVRTDGGGNSDYSVFLISCVVATTALHMSKSSLSSALHLFRSGVFRFADFMSKASDTTGNGLRDLEAVVAMTQFAECVQASLETSPIENFADLSCVPDSWQLSGIGVRIAVDCGLHRSARSTREKALLQAAVTMDRRASVVAGGLPLGIADGAID